ncbi:MAG: COX15/CtaA family protein [Terrimicrobiaceae bacterium]
MGYTFGQRLVHLWAVLTAVATFLLLCSGGIVTSKGVGMAVPDWPTTFGYNMFLFPVSQWVGGIFYEHSHRLIASGVGLMTVILAVATFVLESRKWVKGFVVFLLVAVVVQGLFGGLRVVLNKDHVGIVHALLAQSFFSALVVFCVVMTRTFVERRWADFEPSSRPRRLAIAVTALIFLQLALGATMRHEHIGLAVPDFPLAYGKILPDTSPEGMVEINAARAQVGDVPIKPSFVWIHMAHRAMAVVVTLALMAFVWSARGCSNAIRRMAGVWLVMVVGQVGLGIWTIWSGKAADIATAHMALGALLLAWGVVLSYRLVLGARTLDFAMPDAVRPKEVCSLV